MSRFRRHAVNNKTQLSNVTKVKPTTPTLIGGTPLFH